ncbi:MAG TPA: dihydropteroate synthase [Devosiaceae bacterium]|jgi:dihydropteroate synthase
MGILNVTPDSFSDGGDFMDMGVAVAQSLVMAAEGAAIIDVGGESTRPGSSEVTAREELARVLPALEAIREVEPGVLLSIDSYKAEVAHHAIAAGAVIINDVHGLQRDPEIASVAARHKVPVVAMHWDKARDAGKPLIDEMRRYFDRTLDIASRAGIVRERLILDPGFGFGKTLTENYALLRALPELHTYGLPLLVGMSRKSMLGRLLDNEPRERLAGTIATSVIAYLHGAQLFRVHDVAANRDALRVAAAALYGPPRTET